MIRDSLKKDFDSLVKIAGKQGNMINLSIVVLTLNCSTDELSDVISEFEEVGITVLNEDVEPDADDFDVSEKVIPFDPMKIDIKMETRTIDSIIARINNKEIEFDSSFQRKAGLWTKKQKSQLIESLFLRIPLPAFYFDASKDDRWQIIDGLQRISTMKEFVVDEAFRLTGLEFLTDFDNASFQELPRSMQRRILETNINVYLVSPSTPKNVKFNIFKRINTGGLILQPQEIRNALFQGNATKYLFNMSRIKEFIDVTDGSIKAERMLDREFCLRYAVFTQLDFDKEYTGNMDDYLTRGMEYLEELNEEEYSEMEKQFKKDMDACNQIFGKYAFRRIVDSSRRGPVNKAIFAMWSLVIHSLPQEKVDILIKSNKEVVSRFSTLCDDYVFQNAIRSSDKKSVNTGIKKIKCLVDDILVEAD